MIPYQELCDALASWRSRHGLANGPSARVRFEPAATVVAPAAYDLEPQPGGEAELAYAETATALSAQSPAALDDNVTPITYDGSVDEVMPGSIDQPASGSVDELMADLGSSDLVESYDAPTNLHVVPEPRERTGEAGHPESALVDEDEL